MAEEKKRSRLKTLDDLFKLDAPSPTAESKADITVAIADLTPFRAHPFRLYEGERLEDMVESIRNNGVLIPIIIRQLDDILEILSGHNRVNAAKLAGLDIVPAIILGEISDDVAWAYVIETNLMQRSFSDMAHSEKAAVIAMQHSKLFSQGKRNDILAMLEKLANPHDSRVDGTSAQFEHKSGAREKVADYYNLDRNTVARYLRVNKLIPNLKARLDLGDFGFIPAVELSYLRETEQNHLDKCLGLNRLTVDMRKATLLREYSRNEKLTEDNLYLILNGEIGANPKPNRTPTVKVRKAVYSRYFSPGQPASEVQGIVEKALELYFAHLDKEEATS